ncbi:methyltransferase domain-containing protein [Alteromonas sp. ASW11-130]|uniref:methyltransferase domain-containing protein n=1 Tax=Alteromonas sp. ASW11-130 TaxID=3015775 RepID=UPI00224286F6|nr:methyltransferase domain-containing protein [Alteromonas sp. ASW11-130]MCW8092219.1 rRNA (guanine-N1)-methyltransferase [Alteromonas sp. ASW11-130]
MVRARRNFHDTAGYKPLMQKLSEMIGKYISSLNLTEFNLFEAGCGEGSYLATVTDSLNDEDIRVNSSGIDIAKPAIELAAKTYKKCEFAVGSNFRLPLPTGSQHVVLQVFAPGNMKEYARVLAPRGIVLTVEPGKQHLWELKERIYKTPKQHQPQLHQVSEFDVVTAEHLSFKMELSDTVRQQGLLNMTPYVWKLSDEKRAKLSDILDSVTVDFTITMWTLLPNPKKDTQYAQ